VGPGACNRSQGALPFESLQELFRVSVDGRCWGLDGKRGAYRVLYGIGGSPSADLPSDPNRLRHLLRGPRSALSDRLSCVPDEGWLGPLGGRADRPANSCPLSSDASQRSSETVGLGGPGKLLGSRARSLAGKLFRSELACASEECPDLPDPRRQQDRVGQVGWFTQVFVFGEVGELLFFGEAGESRLRLLEFREGRASGRCVSGDAGIFEGRAGVRRLARQVDAGEDRMNGLIRPLRCGLFGSSSPDGRRGRAVFARSRFSPDRRDRGLRAVRASYLRASASAGSRR
jgi:hypothetical protein